MRKRRLDGPTATTIVALLVLVALVMASCGGGDEGQRTGQAGEIPAAGAVEGCGEDAVTDHDDLAAGRTVARCAAGSPAPKPLAQRKKVRMSSAFRAEFVAPVLLADAFGEFDKENLDFEFVELGFSDALPQMARGNIDVAVGGTEAALFNAISGGIDAKWGLGNFFPPDAGDASKPQTGLWARRDVFSDPANPDLADLKGKKLASAVGLGSVIAYPIALAFQKAGISLLDLKVEQIPSPDMVLALKNKAVDAAWLLDPFWIGAAEDRSLTLVATQPPGEPIGGLYFGRHMFGNDRDKAVAFVRAIIRTISTHLRGDYQEDARVMAELSKQTKTPVEALAATPALVFDWEIRTGTAERIQRFFIEFDTVRYEEPLPESRVVDRSLYLEALGAKTR